MPGDRSHARFAIALLSACIPAGAAAHPAPTEASRMATRPPHARIARMNGIATLVVDGHPFLLLGAQCDIWRSTRQDEKTVAFFDGFRQMNATAVSVGIPWSMIEPAKDAYDFRFLDWFVRQARARGLRLVVNLFNTNVCGKVEETSGSSAYPAYTPAYILSDPATYTRMVLPSAWRYVSGGPPMCPNDPDTLERERRLVARVAEHLRDTDTHRTVIMLQIDNEFYYQQWDGERPASGSAEEKAVRCHCPYCEARWASGGYASGEEFMFRSFADYVRVLTDSIAAIYRLPMYVNSPWWPPHIIPYFLDRCPNLDLVGIDGVLTPREPNMLSLSQVGRNVPFAAENPTENPEVRMNLDVLPYYTVVGRPGLGSLLWESHAPHTVVDDPDARRRYAAALYPIKHAQVPIARARGTGNLLAWYVLREVAAEVTTDVFGNFVPLRKSDRVVARARTFVREGKQTRAVESDELTASLGELTVGVSGSAAGIVVRRGPRELVLAVPGGRVTLGPVGAVQAEEGRFEADRWVAERPFAVQRVGSLVVFEVREPAVIRVKYRPDP